MAYQAKHQRNYPYNLHREAIGEEEGCWAVICSRFELLASGWVCLHRYGALLDNQYKRLGAYKQRPISTRAMG